MTSPFFSFYEPNHLSANLQGTAEYFLLDIQLRGKGPCNRLLFKIRIQHYVTLRDRQGVVQLITVPPFQRGSSAATEKNYNAQGLKKGVGNR